jgi:Phosphotransferase enzyme family
VRHARGAVDVNAIGANVGPLDERWQIAVLNETGNVFALSADGEMTLPVVRVPRGVRVIPQIASILADLHGLHVFCLTVPALHLDGQAVPRTLLAEVCGAPITPANGRWSDPKAVRLGNQQQLDEVLEVCLRHSTETEQPGFWARLQGWVISVLSRDSTRHLMVSGRPVQWNAGRGFCLVRLETSGPAVWFKAVGPPNEAELSITAMVADRHPFRAPRLLATHAPWHGWLTEEVPGDSLRQSVDPETWASVAADIARLQLDECHRGDSWLDSGCVDLRPATLDRKIDEFFSGMEPIFDRQVKTSPPRLLPPELRTIADALRRAFEAAACLPSTLVHADLNPDNVFLQDGHAIFLDWAGASVGFSFAALENLCGHLRRRDSSEHSVGQQLVRESYSSVWKNAYGSAAVDRALSVAPMLRYASLSIRSAGWLWGTTTPVTRDPLLRSLTRSMWREAAAPTR